mmetsp:Transcript_15816/g.36172  ORF Transcript_15816/g.36172 Transcript_15816/m.36172 type:complete len:292 (+) Transcript_15816:513-1388(+)
MTSYGRKSQPGYRIRGHCKEKYAPPGDDGDVDGKDDIVFALFSSLLNAEQTNQHSVVQPVDRLRHERQVNSDGRQLQGDGHVAEERVFHGRTRLPEIPRKGSLNEEGKQDHRTSLDDRRKKSFMECKVNERAVSILRVLYPQSEILVILLIGSSPFFNLLFRHLSAKASQGHSRGSEMWCMGCQSSWSCRESRSTRSHGRLKLRGPQHAHPLNLRVAYHALRLLAIVVIRLEILTGPHLFWHDMHDRFLQMRHRFARLGLVVVRVNHVLLHSLRQDSLHVVVVICELSFGR